ncbi:hypothetical protein CERZMDRAFT_114080 [Cercospora zeae-maydis SCOH1-5]|uniref:NTF2 domain-containing protein n=1 Tax=Cercospora zeae-maydis SCOH1-5 TaxID=717836 RepID=A0A6A6F7D9_9PEZI|nr:hypothetical protein CERZMDRAFT_114080 [Cercospora zeae-maydis SCOH1-5]
MAAEVSGLPNGNYAMHQPHAGGDQSTYSYSASNQNSQPSAAQQAPPPSTTPSNAAPQPAPQPDIPKDEVGWYFVEQYYTTLSRSPEKLYLFYNKRSQFVSGQETDKVAVCVGQRAINDKIRELDFNDCKVRVTNVDSQASDSNIVIQVIGELSNRGQPHRKFTQTFVLATQTNGYFVLNDIFRYLVEEEEEADAEPQQQQQQQEEEVQQVPDVEIGVQEPVPTEAHPTTLTNSADPAAVEHDAEEDDKTIEVKLVNGTYSEDDEKTAAAEEKPATVDSEKVEEAPAVQTEQEQEQEPETAKEAEKVDTAAAAAETETPKGPEPTRAPSSPKQETQKPTPAPAPKPATPAVPKTWASLAASAAKTVAPVIPQPVPQAAKTLQQKAIATNAAVPATATNPATPMTPSAQSSQDAKANDSQDEWTAVGSNHNRNASKQTNSAPPQQEPQFRGYIKNVSDNVDGNKLKAELEKFGDLLYFDIARQKNCAFVDFKTADAYNKAKATQFEVDGNDVPLFVEERKFRPGSTPYIPRGQYQAGRGGLRSGANQGASRGAFQGGRGGPGQGASRGRGGYASAGPRGGRGGAQS